jgi:hypothetical protein
MGKKNKKRTNPSQTRSSTNSTLVVAALEGGTKAPSIEVVNAGMNNALQSTAGYLLTLPIWVAPDSKFFPDMAMSTTPAKKAKRAHADSQSDEETDN